MVADESALQVVRRCQGGLLLDTNVLLLYLILRANPAQVHRWKKTDSFTTGHASSLIQFVAAAKENFVTTPHILAEVSNLSEKVPAVAATAYWQHFQIYARTARERWKRASLLAGDREIATFDLADVAIANLPNRARPVVLTVDEDLYDLLKSRRLPALNLDHHAFV